MHYRIDGSNQVIVPNRPVKTVNGRHVKARVWVNYVSPFEYVLVADFFRHADAKKTHSFTEAELTDVINGAYQARAWIRKHQRRQRLLSFVRSWF
jgi:hypothetical protein